MSNKVKAIPEGYHTITPYLIFEDAAKAIDFYKKAFNAKEMFRMPMPNGKVGHAELRIGNSPLMMADEFPEMNAKAPKTYGGSPISIHLYVEDSDALFNQAVSAGAKVTRPMEDQFYGDRSGIVTDPFGYTWSISTHKEDLTPEQMEERVKSQKKYCSDKQ